MPVTDEQVTALRAFLAFDPSYQHLAGELSGSGRVHGFGVAAIMTTEPTPWSCCSGSASSYLMHGSMPVTDDQVAAGS
jgi:hypothetical protein